MIQKWKIAAGFALLVLLASAAVSASAADVLEQGRRIYQEGLLPSGKPLQGMRFDNVPVEGAAAACIGCHRRSGLGGVEGNSLVPPISAPFLFPGDEKPTVSDPRYPARLVRLHEPYTDASLAKTIRTAETLAGAKMNIMMPRYALNDRDMHALTTYLHQLSGAVSPGVGARSLKFALIIASGVEADRRQVLLDMVKTYFLHRNVSWRPGGRHMRMGADLLDRTEREWQLAVWELQGPEQTWGKQLAAYYAREPVFAVISGLSNTSWAPVHKFCQHERMPCLFPSVDLSATHEDLYPFYFSKGTALEAELLAAYLRTQTGQKPHTLVQVYRDDAVSRGGAEALAHALAGSGIKLKTVILKDAAPNALSAVVKGLSSEETPMFWLHPSDLAALNELTPPAQLKAAYFSAVLAKDPKPALFSSNWKPIAHLLYPFELSNQRLARVSAMKRWLTTYNLPVVDERLQSEVLFDMFLLAGTTSQMLDNLYRDYLVEQVESYLGSVINLTVYPSLGLSTGQRFVSKSGYIAHFDNNKLVAESGRIVP